VHHARARTGRDYLQGVLVVGPLVAFQGLIASNKAIQNREAAAGIGLQSSKRLFHIALGARESALHRY
jgi:hypothetical protein